MILAVPVDPDAEEARDWLLRELADPAYRAAEPNWLDRAATAVRDWIASLLGAGAGPPSPVVITVLVALILAAAVIAYLVFGPPRANRRRPVAGAVFGDDDARNADALRRAAGAAAASADWTTALEEMFRAIARGLAERAVVTASPGTTATGFAGVAGRYFPPLAGDLQRAAVAFDAVRYLGGVGSVEAWDQVERLDRDIRASKPAFGADSAGATPFGNEPDDSEPVGADPASSGAAR